MTSEEILSSNTKEMEIKSELLPYIDPMWSSIRVLSDESTDALNLDRDNSREYNANTPNQDSEMDSSAPKQEENTDTSNQCTEMDMSAPIQTQSTDISNQYTEINISDCIHEEDTETLNQSTEMENTALRVHQKTKMNGSPPIQAGTSRAGSMFKEETCRIYDPYQSYPRTHNIVVSPGSSPWQVPMGNTMSGEHPEDIMYTQDNDECPFKVIVVMPKTQNKHTYTCKECGQHFTKESNLKKHIERLSQDLPEPFYKCKHCDHVFKTKEARKRHHPVHRVPVNGPFTRVRCTICGFKFSSKEKLQHHLHRFTENADERIFKCFFCSHAFTTDFSRNRHEGQMHSDEHRLPCCCCGKLFANRYKMKLHRVKQQIQRPPRCNDCGWVFAAPEYLTDHMRQVQRDLPLECLICHHRYQSHLALLRHLKFHTRKMEFECPSCLGRFSTQNLLAKHLRNGPKRANIEPY